MANQRRVRVAAVDPRDIWGCVNNQRISFWSDNLLNIDKQYA